MIQDSVNKVIYLGDGYATEFAYPFEITKNTDVKVMTVSPDGVETVLTNDYYVDVERSVVAYPCWVAGEEPADLEQYKPLEDGWKLVIYRQVEYTQEVAMFEQHPFKAIEQMIDKATILIQQLKDETARAMRLGVAVDNTGVDLTIPYVAGQSFRWSDDGKRLELTKDPARVEISVQGMLDETIEQCKEAASQAAAAKASEESAKANAIKAENAKNETFDGNWKPNEQVKVGDIRFLGGRENVGYVLECIQAGTTGATQPTFTEDDVELEPFVEAVNVYATATYINKE